jgi:hypothetical protein
MIRYYTACRRPHLHVVQHQCRAACHTERHVPDLGMEVDLCKTSAGSRTHLQPRRSDRRVTFLAIELASVSLRPITLGTR